MPVPKPRKGETEKEFMERCMDFLEREDPDGENDQHIAICLDAWKKKNVDLVGTDTDFKNWFGRD